MGLLQEWRDKAYHTQATKQELDAIWTPYFEKEKTIYEQLLTNPDEEVRGTVAQLADKYEIDIMEMVGFLDGIDESLVKSNNLEEIDENSEVSLLFDKTKLYRNMVGAKAD